MSNGRQQTSEEPSEAVPEALEHFLRGLQWDNAAWYSSAQIRRDVRRFDAEFTAAILAALRELGGRRASVFAAAAELILATESAPWREALVRCMVREPADVTELASYFISGGKPLPACVKRGIRSELGDFSSEQLLAYQGRRRGVSMQDVVRLVRPRPTAENSAALAQIAKGRRDASGLHHHREKPRAIRDTKPEELDPAHILKRARAISLG